MFIQDFLFSILSLLLLFCKTNNICFILLLCEMLAGILTFLFFFWQISVLQGSKALKWNPVSRLSRGRHHFIPVKCKERSLSICWGWKKKKKWDSENNMSAESSSTRPCIYFFKSPELWNHPQVQASWGAVETLGDGCDSKQGSFAVDVQHNVSDRLSFRQTV